MWTVIYVAPSQHAADHIKQKLTQEGMLVMLRPIGTATTRGEPPVEIMVPESEAEEANEIIHQALQF